jgi:thiamine-phosphate pyrophosphorylase
MIIISNPTAIAIAIANEISTIHSLFESGLDLFHVRKPAFSASEMKDFVNSIGLEFRNKLVLHSHHHLAEELGINRIHFTSTNRPDTFSKASEFKTISTSTHLIEEFNSLSKDFDYAFLSPVYPSISKENYLPKKDLFEEIKNRTNFNTKLIALGGIEAQNIKKTLDAGFDDIALLGTIWNSKTPIENFKLCQKIVLS